MQLQILGSAAGGGFPQWNCGCANCQAAREGSGCAHPRWQSSLAVRGATGPFYLINASPDVREQLELLRGPSVRALRSNPIAGVILTDAEIDHTAGLVILRESGEPLEIYGTEAVRHALTAGYPLLEVLDRYCGVRWHSLEPERTLRLPGDRAPALEIEPFFLPADPPLYMRGRDVVQSGIAVGLTFRDPVTGSTATYAPAVERLDEELLARLTASEVALLDGTFWSNEELPSQGIGTRTALDMGHLPLSGAEGTLVRLRDTENLRKILVHINNSNPILLEGSPERQAVEAAGFEVAYDGMLIDL
jgi:pyrroloquinoline quinone biosynthesis protein B